MVAQQVSFIRRRGILSALCVMLCAVSLAGCMTDEPSGNAPVNAALAAPVASDAAAVIPLEDTYRLGAGDKLKITVFGEPELTAEYAVNPAGMIDFPLIGEVQAAGQSLRDFERALTKRLKDGYLRDPRISIEVLNFRPFFITGEVRNSGQFPYKPGLTVQEAVAIAGGYTYRANTRAVNIRRVGADQEQSFDIQTSRVLIYPGDQVRISERFF
jgi:protein involved in polysaccharide export with SLBB domain